jgi:hypothetical protein
MSAGVVKRAEIADIDVMNGREILNMPAARYAMPVFQMIKIRLFVFSA